jgi:hypothetical protein
MLAMNIRAYGTHAGMHVHDPRGLYMCSKCPKRFYDLYVLASHEIRCKGKESEKNERFDDVLRFEYQPQLTTDEATCVLAVARASSAAPKASKAGQKLMAIHSSDCIHQKRGNLEERLRDCFKDLE